MTLASATPAPGSNAATFLALNPRAAAAPTANEAGSEDRFLRLLVTQMQNQDPLNPMDNAQVTSQMAQINTVSGVEKLNTTMESLNGQFLQMQALTGAGLVGRDVTLQGNRLAIAEGVGRGGFDLAATAGNVRVDVLTPSGRVFETINLGAQPAGRHEFTWNASAMPAGSETGTWRFRVAASNGGVAVASTPLMSDRVDAVFMEGNRLVIDTRNSGNVAYADVKAFR